MRYAMLGLLVWVLGCGESFKPDLFPAGGAGGEIGLGAGAGPGGQTASGGVAGADETGGDPGVAGSTSGQAGSATGSSGGDGAGGSGGAATGGSATGGTGTGGAATGGASTGGQATGGSSTGGATACSMTESIMAALPEAFVWQSYASSVFTGSDTACTKCKYSPCGTCPITWGAVVQSSATTYLVPIVSSTCSVPGLYGACPPTASDTIGATAQSAVVTLTVQPQGSGSVIGDAVVSGTWKLTGNYVDNSVGTTALNNSVSQALRGLPIACH